MLTFLVSDITQGGAGPVIHLTEPAGGGEAKIELYLPRGYDVPALAQRFVFDDEAAFAEYEEQIDTLEREVSRLAALVPPGAGASDPTAAETKAPAPASSGGFGT
jgi:hypothetical protein